MWFIIGLFVGGWIGFFVRGLCEASHESEREYGKEVQD